MLKTEHLPRYAREKHSPRGKTQQIDPVSNSVLAVVSCDDGTQWPVKAAVPSKLLEINPRVVADPSLLQRMPRTEGFLGIVRPLPEKLCLIKESLLSKEEYEAYWEKHTG